MDSFALTALARATNQWKLNETETAVPATIHFDSEEFRQLTGAVEEFQLNLLHRLQVTGQSCAFWLGYEDLRDAGVMTGLCNWLGRSGSELVKPASDQVPQNPRELAEKVSNFDEMQAELARLDPFMLRRIPNFEPRKGPAVPSFLGAETGKVSTSCQSRAARRSRSPAGWAPWAKSRAISTRTACGNGSATIPAIAGFTVLRHPLLRAWTAFAALLAGKKAELRQLMRDVHRVPLPDAELAALDDRRKAELFEARIRN